jgi:hypothetical protein
MMKLVFTNEAPGRALRLFPNQRDGRVVRTGFSPTSLHHNYNLNSRIF